MENVLFRFDKYDIVIFKFTFSSFRIDGQSWKILKSFKVRMDLELAPNTIPSQHTEDL